MSVAATAEAIDRLLPQTQCTRCGYPACRPYAEAIAAGDAPINRCPPGGAAGIERLAALLGVDPIALDATCGDEKATETVARVVEADCIGCTKCIQACPVDAIVGGPNLMHTVIASECNGCELCIPPCPVDCIVMVETPGTPPAYERAPQFRRRYDERTARLARWDAEERERRRRQKAPAFDPVAAALAKVRPS
ncbi:MAG TPA: RnfABCDGE type electron transport complex subunit B [Nevskiaceae bacterium]|nr:RnfABCDGE type electron transport complex subunit B [Nevskiaceae bacterium]